MMVDWLFVCLFVYVPYDPYVSYVPYVNNVPYVPYVPYVVNNDLLETQKKTESEEWQTTTFHFLFVTPPPRPIQRENCCKKLQSPAKNRLFKLTLY